MPTLAKDKYCTGCLACKDACRHNAINTVLKNGITYVEVDSAKCIDCGFCEHVCPIVTPVRKNKVTAMSVYGGWAVDDGVRYKGASGGAFGAIAYGFFRQNDKAVVFGATLENNRVRHIGITGKEDVPLLMNSKYIQSNTDGIYLQVKEALRNGYKVLFSGTPCQIAALYGFLGKKRDSDSLWTVELVCHGVPCNEALDLAIEKHKADKIVSFRNKKKGQKTSQCCTYKIGNGIKILKRSEDVFCKIFSTWLLDRKSCSNCKYSSIERVADITLADFWGQARSEDDYKLGVNLVIANNAKADLYIKATEELHTYDSTLMRAVYSNPNLYNGFKYIQYHPLVMWSDFFRKVLPKKTRLAILTRKKPWIFLWAVFKIMTIVHIRIKRKLIFERYKDVMK